MSDIDAKVRAQVLREEAEVAETERGFTAFAWLCRRRADELNPPLPDPAYAKPGEVWRSVDRHLLARGRNYWHEIGSSENLYTDKIMRDLEAVPIPTADVWQTLLNWFGKS